jgi:putative transposase
MSTPHSEDLRIRVIEAVVVEGMSCRAAAKRFRVGEATAIRWVEAYEEEGRTRPLPVGGDRRSKLKPHRDWLLALRRAENDLTLEVIAERLFAAFEVKADTSMLSRFFQSEGISFKKNRARQRAGAAGRGRSSRAVAQRAA